MSTPALELDAPLAPCSIDLGLGARVLVLSDLLLTPVADPITLASLNDHLEALANCEGPGICVIAGNLFDQGSDGFSLSPEEMRASLDAYPGLLTTLLDYLSTENRSVIVLPGWRDAGISDPAITGLFTRSGAQVASSVELTLSNPTGSDRVLIVPAEPAGTHRLASHRLQTSAWLAGLDRLEQPRDARRFVTSRLIYRRLKWLVWLPPLVIVLAGIGIRLGIDFSFTTIDRLTKHDHGVNHFITRLHTQSWATRLTVTLAIVLAAEVLVGLAIALIARRLTDTELDAAHIEREPDRIDDDQRTNDELIVGCDGALDSARSLVASGWSGLIVGGARRSELIHLDRGFYGCCGASGEIVRSHNGRAGLPAVFLHHRQSSRIELETGARLNVSLLSGQVDLPKATLFERRATSDKVVKGYKATADLSFALVASWPVGASYPPAPDVAAERIRTRKIRRIAATAIFVTGLVDLLLAIAPPLRFRLRIVEQLLPLSVTQTAGALVALSGLGLMMLARGILRGQRRPWLVAVGLLTFTVVLHLIHGVSLAGIVVTVAVLILLLVERSKFKGATDLKSSRSGFLILFFGAIFAITAAVLSIELASISKHDLPSLGLVILAVTERLVGITTITLPENIDDFLFPTLVTVGLTLVVIALYLLTRPVVDRRLHGGSPDVARAEAESRATDIVRRHGRNTLDYFALRDDKQFFFYRDSMVAYAVYGGICIASPDPIGPLAERQQIWDAFRNFADRHGWGIGIVGAAEEWLPAYVAAGMRHIYVGDEALVDVTNFSLAGGKMKGLRQANTRVERNGYTASFYDPAQCTTEEIAALLPLLERRTTGDEERGFSMMLGRMFDPRDQGLLLTVVHDSDAKPVALCQFVPSPAIKGYSLDLMRRDNGEHPNGLLDYALCQTIAKLQGEGCRGLSLNFAVLRSALDVEDREKLSISARIERWALLRLSSSLQIESLWRFNAKYEPTWLPRYIVFDSPEQFLPSVISFLRAESVTDIPLLGRLFASNPETRPTAVVLGPGAGAGAGAEPTPVEV